MARDSTVSELQVHLHVSFLRKLHGLGVTTSTMNNGGAAAQESLRRYTQLWLPLLHDWHVSTSFLYRRRRQALLVPPADIAWLWHCHRLAPHKYEEYLQQQFGVPRRATTTTSTTTTRTDGDHDLEMAATATAAAASSLSASSSRLSMTARRGILKLEDPVVPFAFLTPDSPPDSKHHLLYTLEQWNRRYPEEPFFFTPGETEDDKNQDEEQVEVEQPPTTVVVEPFPTYSSSFSSSSSASRPSSQQHVLLCGFDLLEHAKREVTFLWQISGPDFLEPVDSDGRNTNNSMALSYDFLRQSGQNYLTFIKLQPKARMRGHAMVPSMAIDLFWRTQILTSLQRYKKVWSKHLPPGVNNNSFPHHDYLTQTPELAHGFSLTRRLWKMTYHYELKDDGGLYRGEPPQEFYDPKWMDIGYQPTTTTTTTTTPIVTVTTTPTTTTTTTTPTTPNHTTSASREADVQLIACVSLVCCSLSIVFFLAGTAIFIWPAHYVEEQGRTWESIPVARYWCSGVAVFILGWICACYAKKNGDNLELQLMAQQE